MKTLKECRELVTKVAEKISIAGGLSFYVGGCVRDEILKRKNDDLDVEIYGISAETLEEILKEFGELKIVGKTFGVYKIEHYDVDFSLPRTENKVGLKHTDFRVNVNPFLSYKEATARRDFTINALMKNVLTDEIMDENGGLKDLENKIIKHVSDEHFAEDPLRVLRACRFAAQLDFKISEEAVKVCSKMDLRNLSPERIQKETTKALLSKRPALFFRNLSKMNQLSYWYPELEKLRGLPQNKNYHLEDAFEHTMMVVEQAALIKDKSEDNLTFMLAALCHDFGKGVVTDLETGKAIGHEIESERLSKEFMERLKYDKSTTKAVAELCKDHMIPGSLYETKHQKKVFEMMDKSSSPKALGLLAYCDIKGMVKGPKVEFDENQFRFWYEYQLVLFKEWVSKKHVTGEDLLELGFKEGKQLGEILANARKMEYSLPYDQVIRSIVAIYKGDINKMKTLLEKNGFDSRTKEEKFLDRYKSKGVGKEIKPESIPQIKECLIKELADKRTIECPDMPLIKYAKQVLGEDLIKPILRELENSVKII